jgi:hypothetical protein
MNEGCSGHGAYCDSRPDNSEARHIHGVPFLANERTPFPPTTRCISGALVSAAGTLPLHSASVIAWRAGSDLLRPGINKDRLNAGSPWNYPFQPGRVINDQ